VLADASGFSPRAAVLTHSALAIVSLFDGLKDLREIQADLMRSYGELVPLEVIEGLVRKLDECLLLESPTFYAHLQEQLEQYRSGGIRPAYMAGDTYPDDPEDLRGVLDGFFTSEKGPGLPGKPRKDTPRVEAVIAPHIDYARGGPLYAWSYREVLEGASDAELFVILGIDHRGPTDDLYILTEVDYDTPLGRLRTHDEAAGFLTDRLGDEIKRGELSHAGEHSIEFQAVWLRHILGQQDPKALAILCGSFAPFILEERSPADDPEVQRFIEALRDLRKRYRCCIIAGADLAHVGPAFQDPGPVRKARLDSLEEADRRFLSLVAEGRGDPVFAAVRREHDERKICGLPAVYVMLEALGSKNRGRVLAYEQCPADPDDTSWVTACAMSFTQGLGENGPQGGP
jgi:AmmeMemoRadiSam system protein B